MAHVDHTIFKRCMREVWFRWTSESVDMAPYPSKGGSHATRNMQFVI